MSKYKPAFDFADRVEEKIYKRKTSVPVNELVELLPDDSKVNVGKEINLVRDYLCGDIRFEEKDGKIFLRNREEWKKILLNEFVMVDLETTGIDHYKNMITEIGAIKIKDGIETGRFHQLLNPKMKISERIVKLTGISNEMVKDKPEFKEVADEFLNFVDKNIFIAQNASFDFFFLNYHLEKIGRKMELIPLCTAKFAHLLLPNLEKYSLDALADNFNIPIGNRHRSIDDVELTIKVYFKLLDIADEKNLIGG